MMPSAANGPPSTIARYFGMFHSTRRDRWMFGGREGGAYLLKFAWT